MQPQPARTRQTRGTGRRRVHITRNGRDYVVLLAAEDLESIEATLELLADTQAQERIAAGEVDFGRGDVPDEQQVRALIDQGTQPE
ncbi:MAG TPA: type II toxin-antitoxin system Phd/YefM family antitoxin [Pseudonocardiaceae bacterium]